jgi:hypothetical protein
MAPSRESTVKKAVLEYISGDEYTVHSLPRLHDYVWDKLEMAAEDWRARRPRKAHPREIYTTMGRAELSHSLFLMCADDLANKPEGFGAVRGSCLQH